MKVNLIQSIAKTAEKAANRSKGTACVYIFHQPKFPEKLRK